MFSDSNNEILFLGIHVCYEDVNLQCEVCMKQFSSEITLSQHVLTHGEAKYHCFECGKSFYTAVSNLS